MNRPEATTKTKRGSRDIERKNLLGGVRANRAVKAMIGVAIVSASLFLAGCGLIEVAESGSDGQLGSQTGTENSTPSNPGIEATVGDKAVSYELPEINQDKLHTNGGRQEIFNEQGAAMAINITEALASANPQEISSSFQPEEILGIKTNFSFMRAVFSDEEQFFSGLDQMEVVAEESADSAHVDHFRPPADKKAVQFFVLRNNSNPEADIPVETQSMITVFVPEHVVDTPSNPQSLLDGLEAERDNIETAEISFSVLGGAGSDDARNGFMQQINGELLVAEDIYTYVDDLSREPVTQREQLSEFLAQTAEVQKYAVEYES